MSDDPAEDDATADPRADEALSTATDVDATAARRGDDDRPGVSAVERQRPAYTESQVIMTTVKAVSPFALTYGLFVTFHGASAPGGGFQGGAIAAAVILMIAFAFGIESTRDWLSNAVVVGLAVGGVLVFAGTGLASLALGGGFLDYAVIPFVEEANYNVKWGSELVEIGGIAPIVAGVLVGLFFLLAAGFSPVVGANGAAAGEPNGTAAEGANGAAAEGANGTAAEEAIASDGDAIDATADRTEGIDE